MNEIIDYIYQEYYGDQLTDSKQKEKEFEKRMIPYLIQLSNQYHGTLDYTLPGVIFITFEKHGFKPMNKYNFYFESCIFRCNNQINFHQKFSHLEINECDINDSTIYDIIHTFITNIPLEVNQELTKEFIEFSNPF
jgi:hypothetical protein